MKTNMTFNEFVKLISDNAIIFREGKEWDIDEWNEHYITFNEHASRMSSAYIFNTPVDKLVINWAKDFFSPANA